MILKSGSLSGFLRKPDPALWCLLVFGDDEGVVNDTAEKLIDAWGKSSPNGVNIITLDDDDIRREPHQLSDRLETASLLGETDIVRVRTSGEKIAKPILDLVATAESRGVPFANRLILLNGSLNKRSKLRTGLENAKSAGALHVFADTADSLRDFVTARLADANVTIDDDALDDFVSQLPGHRGLANQEAAKLALYGHDLERPISLDDIRQLSRTDIDNDVRHMVQAALGGDGRTCLNEYERIVEAGTSAISVLRILEMEVRRLLEARGLAGTGGDIGRKLKPPVWPSEWPAFRARLDRWSAPALIRLLAAIHDHETDAKLSGPAADAALRILLLDIVKSASRRARQSASR